MDCNLLKLSFLFFTSLVLLALPVVLFPVSDEYIPVGIGLFLRYGRWGDKVKGESKMRKLEIPKRWFKHFYAFAAPLFTWILFTTLRTYLGIGHVPNYMYETLDNLLGTKRKALVSAEHTTLAVILLTIQAWKRFYETHYVSVFSNAKINLLHYMIAFAHYAGVAACLIGESEIYVEGSKAIFNWSNLTLADYSYAVIFLWASYNQLKSNFILANLRKNKAGEVVTLQHKVPKGGLHDYVSSPLQFTEILLHVMLSLILWNSETYHYVTVWVIANQTVTATINHQWLRETFEDYPKQKKALIPGVF